MTATTQRRNWIGPWIAAVGILHSLGGFLIYAKGWRLIAERGFAAGVHDFDLSGTAFWFLVAGLMLVIAACLSIGLIGRAPVARAGSAGRCWRCSSC